MNKTILFILPVCLSLSTFAQKVDKVFQNPKDHTRDMYIAVQPENGSPKAFMFLMDGFGVNPKDVLVQTDLPMRAAKQGILTIIPILTTGSLYFGSDAASQRSLKTLIEQIVTTYHLQNKDFYLGGFSIGGTCAVKYAEEAAKDNYPIKPKAVFAVDPPLDWERVYYGAKRTLRISDPRTLNGEVGYITGRIEKEMEGTPATARAHYYEQSPYSYSDTTQRAVKTLIHTPIMLISEPDIQWWMTQRGFDYTYLNITDHAAMINELQKLGNTHAVLVTTMDKGYRQPGHTRHPHSWSIADSAMVTRWLQEQ